MNLTKENCKRLYDRLSEMIEMLASYAGIGEEDVGQHCIPLMQWEKGRRAEEAQIRSEELKPEEMMIQFARSLQNSGQMIRSIRFDERERRDALDDLTCGFNPNEFLRAYKDADGFYDALYEKYSKSRWTQAKYDGGDQKYPTNLKKYAQGLYSAAEFLAESDSVDSINQAIVIGNDDFLRSEENVVVPFERMREKIKYLGEALSYDFLKECGCLYLAKPDTHLKKVFGDLKITNDDECYHDKTINPLVRTVSRFAALLNENGGPYAEVTPYKIDKMIWLVCTGNFYLAENGIHGYRDMLIQHLMD